jgi:hypothetical protein
MSAMEAGEPFCCSELPEGVNPVTARSVQKSCSIQRTWFLRAAVVLVVTGLVDCIAVGFAQRPLPWALGIGSSLPISMAAFVIIPMLRQESRKSR